MPARARYCCAAERPLSPYDRGVEAERRKARLVGVEVLAVGLTFDDLKPGPQARLVKQPADLAETAADIGADGIAADRSTQMEAIALNGLANGRPE